ncbi:hypothetical protein PMAYCL1PPCAC_02402, partial [Pristionchus mayeri]
SALSTFKKENMTAFEASKPFAVIFSGVPSMDDASPALLELKEADYSFVGIAFTPDAQKYLLTLIDSVYLFTNDVDEAAQFVVNATCAV